MSERTPAEQARAVANWLGELRRNPPWPTGALERMGDAANAVAEYLERLPAREPDQVLVEWRYKDTPRGPWHRREPCLFANVANAKRYIDAHQMRQIEWRILEVYIGTPAREPELRWLRDRRTANGLSLREVASATGITTVRLGEIERGVGAAPSEDESFRIRAVVGTPAPAVPAEPTVTAVCEWRQDGTDVFWGTGCGNAFIIEEGPPSENQMRFCCYCGGELREVLASQELTPP